MGMNRSITLGLLLCLATTQVWAAKPWTAAARPPMPIAEDLIVELDLTRQQLDADVAGFWKALQEDEQPGIVAAVMHEMGNGKAQSAQVRAAELRQKLTGFPFAERFNAEIRRNFDGNGLSPRPQFVVVSDQSGRVQPTDSTARRILVLRPRYAISGNFVELSVNLTASYVDRFLDKKGRPVEELRFQRGYAWRYRMPEEKGLKADGYAAKWAQLEPDRLTAMIDAGVVQSIALLNYNFSQKGRAEDDGRRRGMSAAPAPAGAVIQQGWVNAFDGLYGLAGIVPFDWQVPVSSP